ncbi:MFS transporter, partial [Lentzea sp. CC55]|uniref:MFS transporter n=1 Tax=Lentzea sp. CC55 TaxID=2884909 RepID=UPI0027DF8EDD
MGRRWLVLAILCASLLLVSVDATVLHMALPALAEDLRPTATSQLWIIAVYSLVAAPLLLAFGTLGDRYGRRRILVLGYVVFGLASLACAWAPDVAVLIGARAVLGVGGAMIMPATLSLLRQAFPDRAERQTAIGIWSGVAGSGAVLGPLLGGFLVQTFSWHAAFLINVPVMLAAIPLTFWLIPESADPPAGPWDVLSAVLAALGVIGVAFAIKQTPHGGTMYLLGPAAGLLGCLLLAAFVRRQRKLAVPLLDVTLFRD